MDKAVFPVSVNILEKEYSVACPAGEEGILQSAAKRVDSEMRRIKVSGKVVGTDRMAVIVAINLAYELMQSERTVKSLPDTEQVKNKLQQLESVMEQALDQHQKDLFSGIRAV